MRRQRRQVGGPSAAQMGVVGLLLGEVMFVCQAVFGQRDSGNAPLFYAYLKRDWSRAH